MAEYRFFDVAAVFSHIHARVLGLSTVKSLYHVTILVVWPWHIVISDSIKTLDFLLCIIRLGLSNLLDILSDDEEVGDCEMEAV